MQTVEHNSQSLRRPLVWIAAGFVLLVGLCALLAYAWAGSYTGIVESKSSVKAAALVARRLSALPDAASDITYRVYWYPPYLTEVSFHITQEAFRNWLQSKGCQVVDIVNGQFSSSARSPVTGKWFQVNDGFFCAYKEEVAPWSDGNAVLVWQEIVYDAAKGYAYCEYFDLK